jgi:hypothetical protein
MADGVSLMARTGAVSRISQDESRFTLHERRETESYGALGGEFDGAIPRKERIHHHGGQLAQQGLPIK